MWWPPPKLIHFIRGMRSPNFSSNAATARSSASLLFWQSVWKWRPSMPSRSRRSVMLARVVPSRLQAPAGGDPVQRRAVAAPLRGRIEHDVIGERHQLAHLAVGVRGRVGVHLAAE